ncbi:MAG TPA: M20/M25/M40 family metallo-hydrolase [Thermoanaerobaculia bacterium]|nr:M20/M25/M40 family metallo-hydrolase [Thermoanaerobaculia bacterium]
MLDPVRLARELVDIPSVTGEEEAHARRLAAELAGIGLTVERQEIAPGRSNLFATAGGKPRVILCSHLDTVPPFFGAEETAEHLYGRGACDTKGIIASMVAAAEALMVEGVREFGVLLVVGEETDSIGAKEANRHFAGRGSEFVVVGEPTESRFARASKGALTATIAFEGIAAHSAYPERGESAIRKLARAVEAIHGAAWGEDEEMGKGTPNVGVIRGGEKANIVPARAEAECLFRIVEPLEAARERLEKTIAPFGGTIARWHGNDPVRMVVPEGVPSTVVSFNTDVPHLRALGKPLLFGPGSILDAHAAREKIAKRELIAAVETYRRLVADLLKGAIRTDG